MLEVPPGSISSHWDLFGRKLEYELSLAPPTQIRARGSSAPNFQALPIRSLSKAACWGSSVLPPIQTLEDGEFLRHSGCDAGRGGHTALPMPLEAFIESAAAWDPRQLAARKR